MTANEQATYTFLCYPSYAELISAVIEQWPELGEMFFIVCAHEPESARHRILQQWVASHIRKGYSLV